MHKVPVFLVFWCCWFAAVQAAGELPPLYECAHDPTQQEVYAQVRCGVAIVAHKTVANTLDRIRESQHPIDQMLLRKHGTVLSPALKKIEEGLNSVTISSLATWLASFGAVSSALRGALGAGDYLTDPPYFQFIPSLIANVPFSNASQVDATIVSKTHIVTPTCGGIAFDLDAVPNPTNSSEVQVRFDMGNATGTAGCIAEILLTVGAGSKTVLINAQNDQNTQWNVTIPFLPQADEVSTWFVNAFGVNVFCQDQSSALWRLLQITDTALLFVPLVAGKLDPISALHNIEFLSNYSYMTPYPVPRAHPGIVPINTSLIHSGDLFAKLDLNGLGPTESFAQGTTSGHTVIAMRNASGLYACESVEQGIMCTEYNQWIVEMQNLGAHMMWMPLAPSLRALFNVTDAWKHVDQFVGNSYGYFNFFFGWIDTEDMNYPCFPWSFKRCISFEIVEHFFLQLELDPLTAILSNLVVGQALSHRAHMNNLSALVRDSFFIGDTALGISPKKLMTVPEQDTWLYNSTKRGIPGRVLLPSQVCSTFACSTLRAAGVFQGINNNISCTEIDVWDIFSMKIFDDAQFGSGRPQVCIDADPDNPNCQLSGNWTFYLVQDVNTRPVAPMMSLTCASRNPTPYNHTGC